ncbi:MAG: alkaline phosphatase D family protein [Robiginitalea sp.]|uniref:alkaline phosphatase D family protein n=1 Tax=Robiginitalea sp. TaxID=1902411 RepID=UPI003C70F717
MKELFTLFCALGIICSCKSVADSGRTAGPAEGEILKIAFGSCNDTDRGNLLWDDILALEPDLWIWGGDNVYADTDDMEKLREYYAELKAVPGYRALEAVTPVIGTWDDHDYGLNDGGAGFKAREASQQVFLDFLGVPATSPRRQREGVYAAHTYTTGKGEVKIFVLDTRYFRSELKADPEGKRRYVPHTEPGGTILGEAQWAWLEGELKDSQADFNILVSSIQVLSGEHGFETWGNFPDEVARLLGVIADSGARGVMVFSGDRHISEFSRSDSQPLGYSLVDFTSSGLTHAYKAFKGEPNPYRIGQVISVESFGWVILDFTNRRATFQIRGDGNKILQELSQTY